MSFILILALGIFFLSAYTLPGVRNWLCDTFRVSYNPAIDLVLLLGASMCLSSVLGLLGFFITLGAVFFRSRI